MLTFRLSTQYSFSPQPKRRIIVKVKNCLDAQNVGGHNEQLEKYDASSFFVRHNFERNGPCVNSTLNSLSVLR